MAATLVEATTLANATSFANPLTVPVSATIESGDVIVVALAHYRYDSNSVTWSVTGGGVTLTSRGRAADSTLSTNQPVVEFFTGTATGDADVQVTRAGTTWRGMHRVWVFRGVTESDIDFDAAYDLSDGTTYIESPAVTAGPDQVVIAFGCQNGSGTGNRAFFQTYTPATGWTSAANTSGAFCVGGTAHRIPSASESHQVADGDAGASGVYVDVYTLARLRIGSVAVAGSTGTIEGALPALTGSLSGVNYNGDPIHRLTAGATTDMTVKSGTAAVVSSRFASNSAGTEVLAATDLPITPDSLKVSAKITVDKTAGRSSFVGVSTVATASLGTTSHTAEIGHLAGSGIVIRSTGGNFTTLAVVSESALTDGDEYLVTLAHTGTEFSDVAGTGTGEHRWSGWAQRADGTAAPYTASNSVPADRTWSADPVSLIARTNSAVGTIRDLVFAPGLFTVDSGFGQMRTFPYYGTEGERMGIWTRSLAAPLKLVVFIGGATSYGGWNNLMGYALAGSPRDDYRTVIHALVEAGYTVITPNALHSGWGSDEAIASTLEAISDVADAVGASDHSIYYLAYSMGGVQGWRALLGRASHPAVEAFYSIAGVADLDGYVPGATYDSPLDATGAELIATGTRVRSVIGTSDTNVPQDENHDLMAALYAGDPLFEADVLTGVSHFQAAYWDGADVVAFYDGATLRTGAIAGTLPAITGDVAGGTGTTAGTIDGTLPAITGSVSGTITRTGAIDGTLPAITGSLAGAVGEADPSDLIELDAAVDLLVESFESQQHVDAGDTQLTLDAGVKLEVVMPLTPTAPPLAVLTEWPLRRQSHQMPALTAANPRYGPGDYTVVTGEIGRMHYFVDGVDVTYLRNVPMTGDHTSAVPFQSVSASLSVPQQKPWDEPGEGDLAPFDMDRDPSFDVVLVKPDDTLDYLWEGFLAREQDSTGQNRLDCKYHAEGLFMQAAAERFDPPVIQRPVDPGHLIADILNSVTHRRWTKIPRFTTGLPPVTDRGQIGQTKWQRVQEILARCVDSDLRQLTLVKVARRTYRLQWKQAVAVDQWTVTKGAPGVEVNLSRDQSSRVDALYGRGVALDGGAWANFYFPGLEFYKIPAYPMSGFAIMYAGTTDADTTTGRGVTDWQKRMRFIGYPVSVDGVLNSTDLAWIRRIQSASGILVDGQLGPQTWAATFNPGKYEQNLKRVRLPLATATEVEPWLWSATGAILGPNPEDDPSKIRRALDVDFGSMDKSDAFPLAENMRELLKEPAWVGTINLLTDPHEGSRFEVRPGDNVKPVGHRDEPNLQVAEVRAQGLEVSLTVDSIGRDILAVDAVLQRDQDARRDPTARRSRNTDMLGLNKSEVVEYESESKAGFFPRTAVNGNAGLWTVLPIFVSQIGVAKIEFTATAPKAELVVALCSKPITANRLAAHVPDPLSDDSGWYDDVETLKERYGVLEVYGTPSNPGGYWPRQKGAGALTGVLKDTSSLLYNSAYGGFVWVGVFTSVSTWVEGRVFPATSR